MRTLNHDTSRCAGRLSFDSGADSICHERQSCLRYLTIEREKLPDYRGIPFASSLRDTDGVCRMKIEDAP